MKRKFLAPVEVKEVDEKGSFSGYGSVFGVEDSYGDIVAPGAFKVSLASHEGKGSLPAMLWQHDPRLVAGVFTAMKEDDYGLYVEGKLAMGTNVGREAYELLSMKAVSGLSIGFRTIIDEYNSDTNIRTLKEVDLWEVSLVTFPANGDARVDAIKSISEVVDPVVDLKSAEMALRELGLSHAESTAFVSRFKSVVIQSESEKREAENLRASVRSLISKIEE